MTPSALPLFRFDAPADGHLTDEMKAAWDACGCLVLENFASAEACEQLKARASRMVDEFDPSGVASIFRTGDQSHKRDEYFQNSGDKVSFFFEPEAFLENGELRQAKNRSINKMGHAMHDLEPAFSAFSRSDKLANLAQDAGFAEPQLLQSMYIFKQPFIGGEVDCHQDSTFLYTDPLSCVGFWFAIEDATLENGAMFALPGAHKGPLAERFRYQGKAPNDALIMEKLADTDWNMDDLVSLEAKQGTLILLHGSLPHMSGANRSPRSRHAYTLHVIDGAAHYPADNWLRRDFAAMPMRGFRPDTAAA